MKMTSPDKGRGHTDTPHPPQNIEAEQGILGAILLDGGEGGTVASVMEVLRPEHFYRPSHRAIFEAMITLSGRGDPIDILTVEDALKKMGNLEGAGGAEYIAVLPDKVSTSRRAVHYAELVKKEAIRRRLIDAGRAITEAAYDPSRDPDEIIDSGSRALLEIGGASSPKNEKKSTVVCLADVEAEEVSWVWYPYIPTGKLTIIEGDPGVGKSWITLGIATSLSIGAALPGTDPFGPARTLIYTVEDGLADTIRPRLDAMGADVNQIHAEPEPLIFDMEGLERVEADIKRLRPSLIIIDPIMAFMGAKVDINKANETRAVLAQLAGIAERYDTSILAVRHLRKSESAKAMYRGMGSIDFTAAARSVLLVGRNPDDQDSRAIAHIKSNLAPMGPSLGYEIRNGKFAWTGESDLTAEQLLAGDVGTVERSAIEEAESFLTNILASGPVEVNTIIREAKRAGNSERTLKRAKQSLGVLSKRDGYGTQGKYFWELPAPHRVPNDVIECQESSIENLAPYEETGLLCEEVSPETVIESPQNHISASVASEEIEEGVL